MLGRMEQGILSFPWSHPRQCQSGATLFTQLKLNPDSKGGGSQGPAAQGRELSLRGVSTPPPCCCPQSRLGNAPGPQERRL